MRNIMARMAVALLRVLPKFRKNGAGVLVDLAMLSEIRRRNLTYLSAEKLRSLVDACRTVEEHAVPGLIVEAGCALGGSAIALAKTKQREREFRVYDVFAMIPAPGSSDTSDVHARYEEIKSGRSRGIGNDVYYGYRTDLFDTVLCNFRDFGVDLQSSRVHLIKGLLQETMSIDQPVALAHIDVDWYDPVMTCLKRIVPRLSVGGMIVMDDYHDWGGCRRAVDEFFAGINGAFTFDDSARSLKITRLCPQGVDSASAE